MKIIVVIVMVIISTIFNIVSSIIVKREVDVIKYNFKKIRNIYRSLKIEKIK